MIFSRPTYRFDPTMSYPVAYCRTQLSDISRQLAIVFGFSLFFFAWAIWNYRKRA
jgi:hypothetical protein